MQPCSVCHLVVCNYVLLCANHLPPPLLNGLITQTVIIHRDSVESQESKNSLVGCLYLCILSSKAAKCLLGLWSHLKTQLGRFLVLWVEFSFSRTPHSPLAGALSQFFAMRTSPQDSLQCGRWLSLERGSEWESTREYTYESHSLFVPHTLWVSLSSQKWHPSLFHIIFTRSKSLGAHQSHSREDNYVRAGIREVEIDGCWLIGCPLCVPSSRQ